MAITLQPLKLADVKHIMTWVNAPEVIKNFQHFNKKNSRKDEENYIKKMLASKNDYVFSVFDNSTYIGQCGIHQISWENKLGRLSMIIKKESWNKGYGQKLLKILIKYAFRELKLHKVWLIHYSTNKKASHLYKKVGFKQEGILKDEYFWKGRYHDMVRMAVIASRSQEN